MSKPLWSGRFDSAPDPAAFDFGVSFPFDRRLFEDDVTGSLAWAEALVACGALSGEDGHKISEGLRPGQAARDVVFEQAPIEWERDAEIKRVGIGRRVEPSGPQGL